MTCLFTGVVVQVFGCLCGSLVWLCKCLVVCVVHWCGCVSFWLFVWFIGVVV